MKHGIKTKLGWIVLIINIICIVFLVTTFEVYDHSYKSRIQQQNIIDIANLNRSSGELSIKYFESQKKMLSSISQYTKRNKLSISELLEFLYDFNAHQQSKFEIIGTNFEGYYVKKEKNGEFIPISYATYDYIALRNALLNSDTKKSGKVMITPEFTDEYNAVQSFALYTSVRVYDKNNKASYYTLMSMSKSADFIEMIQINGDYDEMDTVLFDSEGNYIIGNNNFKSNNFFKYMYNANSLTLDEKNTLAKKILSSNKGTLYYKNYLKEDCAFVYSSEENVNWYVLSSVPLSSFKNMDFGLGLTLYVVIGILIMFISDILWLLSLNTKLKISMEKERRANDAKTDFLSRMSHDIRTPLNAVIGFSELAISEKNLSQTVFNYLMKIQASGKYLLGLINDILDMSKIESKKFVLNETLVNSKSFFDDIAAMFSSQAEQKDITLKMDLIGVNDEWVYMDKLRSRQIYSNLLNNAIKFSDSGTTITMKVVYSDVTEEKLVVDTYISDQGCGMSPEFLKNMFKPFEQELNNHSENEGGTGLGLSIVYNLVQLMNGTIEVESELGKGTTFKIHMERKIGTKPDDTNEIEKLEESNTELNGKRVLLCEDHPLNREIAIRLLEDRGMITETAENGKVGLDKFVENNAGYYDIVLMDVRMPVMNGYDTTRAIRESDKKDSKTIPIIAMTANAFEDDIQECLNAGMNAHIAKPIETKKLFDTIKKWLS